MIKKINFYFSLIILITLSLIAMNNLELLSSNYTNYFNKQLIVYLVCFSLLIILNFINIEFLFKYSLLIYLINLVLLLLVLFIGKEVNGAKAWLIFKGISIQPSELMKISLILFLSTFISKQKFNVSFKSDLIILLKIFLIFLIPSILTFLEPDTGGVIIYLIITLSILIISKLKYKWLIYVLLIFILLIITFYYLYQYNSKLFIKLLGTNMFYRIDRLLSFKNNLQLENALVLIGTSGLFGHQNIPIYIIEAPTDFIFTLIVTKLGFTGGLILILSYLFLIMSIVKQLKKVNNLKYYSFVLTFLIIFSFQIIYSLMMNLGLLPIMGITLPLVSYGGSSLLTFFILLAISKNIIYNKDSKGS